MRPSFRVALLTPDFPPARGGIQHMAHRLAEHIRADELGVVTFHQPLADEFDRTQPFAIERVRHGRRRKAAIARLNLQALSFLLRFRPDVVLSEHIVTSPAAALAKRILRVPVVQHVYALEVSARPRLARFAFRSADRSIAVSRYAEQLAIEAGARPERLHIIPPGVDISPRPRGDRAGRPTVVTVAQLESRYKGFDVMVRALPLVRARVPELEWVIVGEGPLRGEIERLLVAHGLDGVARFVGALSSAERDLWLDRAHVFAMPSRLLADGTGGEGFGIAFLEAGMHCLPVVGGNVGGTLDAVVHQRTGLLVDPLDHVAVAGAISELLCDPARASELGRGGRERAEQNAWPRIARLVEDLLLEVAAR
jgi:phosphatidylinositol alpha-1,6-mannosyltransferase